MFIEWQQARRHAVESFLEVTLAQGRDGLVSARLEDAMRYSAVGAGKRIRALLTYAAGEALGASLESLTPIAAALECVHAYSLVHDDLPAMDDDRLRRGKPTNHIQFDEATAILAGDALQSLAFELVLHNDHLSSEQIRSIGRVLADASGRSGMVAGQMLDILHTGTRTSLDDLKRIHLNKTGALIVAAVQMGALASRDCSQHDLQHLNRYAQKVGLAFQVVDDILDVTSTTEALGKVAGADTQLQKATYPALLGLEESKRLASSLLAEALESIRVIGNNTDPLAGLAEQIVTRQH